LPLLYFDEIGEIMVFKEKGMTLPSKELISIEDTLSSLDAK